ncbi:MAG: glycoside hydrolase family 3 C-terminal domain-containing protein [Bacteroidales bacterium]|nr:glycoside hydrolase family 3 C-terminal domain-containing protein [Bacteroidales bacterium]
MSVILMLSGLISCQTGKKTTRRLGEDPPKKVVAAMSLKDKAELVVGTGYNFVIPDSVLKLIPEQFREMLKARSGVNGDSAYKVMVNRIKTLVPGAAGRTAEFPEYNISTMVLTDGPAGLRILPWRSHDTNTYYCTAFPIATLLASSWDTSVVRDVGRAMGNEVLEYGSDILLAPALNIHRNPLCGRNFEYYSEDPLIAGQMAAAIVRGIQSQGVGTSIKHFVANNQETWRTSVNVIVSQRALREIYLKGFHIAIENSHPWTVMSAYNKVNGTYASENHDLLTGVLRHDWGFQGVVMSDWGAGSDPAAMLKAGNDLIMPGSYKQIERVIQAVDSGELAATVLDENVERILNLVEKTPRFRGYKPSGHPDMKAHAEVARYAATQGMILLKNRDDVLPLSAKNSEIALLGNASYESIIGGTGSGDVNEAYSISIDQGLENAGFHVDQTLKKTYHSYVTKARANMPSKGNWLAIMLGGKLPVPEMRVDARIASKLARRADIAIITIGRNAGEGMDRKMEEDFMLSDTEKALIGNVTQAFHAAGKKVVVVLNIDGVIETVSWRDQPDAILLAWQPGLEAGNAVADVLTGKVNPSGKLATTFPVTYQDEPSAANFPGKATGTVQNEKVPSWLQRVPAEVDYAEDIYVGYRYFNTFDKPVAYPFGYGLSYTSFEYENLKPGPETFSEKYSFSIDVKNTGKTAGKEVVEVYLHAPAGELDKPEEELKAFAKTRLLKPGEVQTLHFTLTPEELASFDENKSAWVAEAGAYEVRVGASSRDIRGKATFRLEKTIMVRKVNDLLKPPKEINKLFGSSK